MKTGVKKRDNPYVCWGLTAFCVLLACILAFLLLSNLGKVFSALGWFCSALSPVLYGLAFGYLLCPLMNRVERLLRPRLERALRRPRLAQRLARGAGIVVAEGTVIGHKRIVVLEGVTTAALRVRILDARVAPTLRFIGVYA